VPIPCAAAIRVVLPRDRERLLRRKEDRHYYIKWYQQMLSRGNRHILQKMSLFCSDGLKKALPLQYVGPAAKSLIVNIK